MHANYFIIWKLNLNRQIMPPIQKDNECYMEGLGNA